MELSEIRKKIDSADDKLLALFLERMELSDKAAEYKAEHGLPVFNPGREREILNDMMSKSGEMNEYTHRLFSCLFELSRARQADILGLHTPETDRIVKSLASRPAALPRTGTVACQGVDGAYSSLAAKKFIPMGSVIFVKTLNAVFNAVESGLCQFGVIPLENSTNGSVRRVYELLDEKKVSVIRNSKISIRHELLAKPGVEIGEISRVMSHPQALSQCSEFLACLGDTVDIIPTANTAEAAAYAAASDGSCAAIASHECSEIYGLNILNNNIQNSEKNYTRFILIAKDNVIFSGADRLGVILTLKHTAGMLHRVLSILAAREINILKLESYPAEDSDFEFRFFLELQASPDEPGVIAMLADIESLSESFRIIGSYTEI